MSRTPGHVWTEPIGGVAFGMPSTPTTARWAAEVAWPHTAMGLASRASHSPRITTVWRTSC